MYIVIILLVFAAFAVGGYFLMGRLDQFLKTHAPKDEDDDKTRRRK